MVLREECDVFELGWVRSNRLDLSYICMSTAELIMAMIEICFFSYHHVYLSEPYSHLYLKYEVAASLSHLIALATSGLLLRALLVESSSLLGLVSFSFLLYFYR